MTLTTDGRHYDKEKNSLFYQFFLLGNVYNESCYECQYRDASCADIRIGDFWGPKFKNNKKGVSMVIPCTDMGINLLKELNNNLIGTLVKENISDYYNYQQTKNAKKPMERKKIIENLKDEKKTLLQLSNEYCKSIIFERKKYQFLMKQLNNIKKVYYFLIKREKE